MSLYAEILSPERSLYSAEVEGVTVPGEQGRFEILTGHAPIISTLTSGEVVCRGNSPMTVRVKSGFVEVVNNHVTVCVEV